MEIVGLSTCPFVFPRLSLYFFENRHQFVNSLVFHQVFFPIPPSSSPYSAPDESEGRSPFRLRLQGQDPLAFATLLLMGRPVPLLALRATVAGYLTATTDIKLSKPPFN